MSIVVAMPVDSGIVGLVLYNVYSHNIYQYKGNLVNFYMELFFLGMVACLVKAFQLSIDALYACFQYLKFEIRNFSVHILYCSRHSILCNEMIGSS